MSQQSSPLISVIIPCYNHARYLGTAIKSVLSQAYKKVEIIVIDDGSTDDTKAVAESFPGVKYFYKMNGGLSAARNTGIDKCEGHYLVFLDADDWLLPGAFEINLKYLSGRDNVAFVSGAYKYLYELKDKVFIMKKVVDEDHYRYFLESNYIGMHATVLYQRWIFDEIRYDTSLKVCEDYDLYLRIARKFPVLHHTELIAVYRVHDTNMSTNIILLLDTALAILKKQKVLLQSTIEHQWYKKGLAYWKECYVYEIHHRLLNQMFQSGHKVNWKEFKALWRFDKKLAIRFIQAYSNLMARFYAKKVILYTYFKKKIKGEIVANNNVPSDSLPGK